jgi:hypothetical protein
MSFAALDVSHLAAKYVYKALFAKPMRYLRNETIATCVQ